MTTHPDADRVALGARLRELRTDAGLTGKDVAARLRWQRSRVSRLETGKQTPTPSDLDQWAAAVGAPETAADLKSRLRGVRSQQRAWRRQLASGHRGVQEKYVAEYRRTSALRGYEATVVPGLFQTPEYARHLLIANADLMGTPRDTEAAVRARMKRQEVLYEMDKTFRILLWEGALHALVCPPEVMAGQLDRLMGLMGMTSVSFGIVPLGAPLRITPKHGFWIFDEERVVVETINTELQLESADDVTLYGRVWDLLNESALHDAAARRLLGRARVALG
ncbi:helix-turn-helix domain-containing protein [Streptomyces alboflavus]|uniref:helix-turn-helix domain-containing protein n=1 Tax=Streptomyces alboflavus TaxID=67267 RepID=UPI000B42A63A|nr:helix-turn-helix transcriptional regulator [Streptomyces alboflavus]